jgi:nucleotide-binding universal stress UspA family protein
MLKILLPVDGSEAALDAVRHALDMVAAGLHASFVLVNVQEPASLYELVVARDAPTLERVAQGAGRHALEPAEALIKVTGTPYESEVVAGDPAAALVEAAERHDCEAIVMGARGVGALRSALIGSVSQSLLHRLSLPITIVRHPDRTLDDEP